MQQVRDSADQAPLVWAEDVRKRYGATIALSGVTLELRRGEVLAVAGENGAGKSTLMKIIAGAVPAGSYDGSVSLGARRCAFRSIADAEAAGITLIPQELQVAPELSISENMLAGHLPRRMGFVRRSAAEETVNRWLGFFGLGYAPTTRMRYLSASEQRLVVIAGALSREASVLILDEPTVALAVDERTRLFDHLRKLRGRGTGILFVTHQLDEIGEIADRVIAIRNGSVAARLPAGGDLDRPALIRAMLGKELNAVRRVRAHPVGADQALKVANVTAYDPHWRRRKVVSDVTFALHRGEILGLFGIIGAGAGALATTVAGAWPGKVAGTLEVDGWSGWFKSPRGALDHGIAMVTGNRQATGILPGQSVMANLSAGSLARVARAGIVSRERERERALGLIEQLKITALSPEAPISSLSGGNQQKVLLGRCLATQAKILILEEPTLGIDIGSRAQIYDALHWLTGQGTALLMASTDVEEITSQCDRILVFRRGELVADRPGGTPTTELLGLATGDTTAQAQTHGDDQ
jgi:ABC-type sugar transport system ATPase subunit